MKYLREYNSYDGVISPDEFFDIKNITASSFSNMKILSEDCGDVDIDDITDNVSNYSHNNRILIQMNQYMEFADGSNYISLRIHYRWIAGTGFQSSERWKQVEIDIAPYIENFIKFLDEHGYVVRKRQGSVWQNLHRNAANWLSYNYDEILLDNSLAFDFYIEKVGNITESSDEEIKDLLGQLSGSIHRLKTYAQFKNRMSTIRPESIGSRLNDEYEEYFYSMMDDGWKYYRDNVQFHSSISLSKAIKYSDAEKEFPHILNEMIEVKNRFTADGFECHFLIFYAGKAQQSNNPVTYKNDLYEFKGVGENKESLKYYDKEFPPSLFPRDEYFLAKIDFVYI